MKAGSIRCPTCGHGFADIEVNYDMSPGSCTESRVYGTCRTGHPLQVRLTAQALEVAAGPLPKRRERE